MKKKWNKSNCSFTYARDGSDDSARRCSALSVKAEPVTMGHLKSEAVMQTDISGRLHLKHLFCQKS